MLLEIAAARETAMLHGIRCMGAVKQLGGDSFDFVLWTLQVHPWELGAWPLGALHPDSLPRGDCGSSRKHLETFQPGKSHCKFCIHGWVCQERQSHLGHYLNKSNIEILDLTFRVYDSCENWCVWNLSAVVERAYCNFRTIEHAWK